MTKSSRHSKGKAIVKSLRVITLLSAMVVIDGVAIGLLSNINAYLQLQPMKGAAAAVASAGSPSTYALGGTATSYRQ